MILTGEDKCPECGTTGNDKHISGGLICRMLADERFQKHGC